MRVTNQVITQSAISRLQQNLQALERDWLQPALAALAGGRLASLVLDTEDGATFTLAPGQRWRFWRRPRPGFQA